ncbi:MAG TPA: GDSL family lipase, partial [Janibacter terrae]|nr:GDSL family lipase [Janibacter terrae]
DDAAERAASTPGTEVGPAHLSGKRAGPRGPWAMLRRRGVHEVTDL